MTIPDVHTNDRAIPAGKVLLCNTPPAGDPRATPETLARGRCPIGREIRLEAIPAGWACAGSMMRWDNGAFRVAFENNGATHGRRFADYTDARALFDRWTGPAA